MNLHNGHEATCLCCKHLDSDFDSDWSDVTPGVGEHWDCRKYHFIDVQFDEAHEEFGKGRTCPDFEGR